MSTLSSKCYKAANQSVILTRYYSWTGT